MQMYQKALRDGFVNVYRGRIYDTILSEVSEQISRSLAVELFPSRQLSREKEMMASDVFFVKIVRVSNLQTFIYAFNVRF